MTDIRHHDAQIEGPLGKIRLHVAEAGPKDGKPVVLLHGFPEFWYGWHHQIGPLAQAGYRVLVPDQRGYGLSEKPQDVASYAPELLASDIVGLLKWAGLDKARIVGHDWGGGIAWFLAWHYPEKVERLVILNCPHPRVILENFKRRPSQLLKSWYMFVFQIPIFPERYLSGNRFRALVGSLRTANRREAFTKEEIEKYREAWGQPGALRGMVNWYRAFLSGKGRRAARMGKIKPPTTIIWGERDPFLGAIMARESVPHCERASLFFLPNATHWLQHEEPERVTQLILDGLEGAVDGAKI